VDIDGRTSNPGVFAIGDVSRRPLPLYGDRMHRIESVQNAVEQAKHVSAALLGLPRPEPEVPWFWSDQFDVKLKIAGLSFDPDEIILRGSPSSGAFSVLHLKQGALICAETVNLTADFMASKTLIARGGRLPAAILPDTQIPLKALAA
jgi:3-phenylpropionate/trans-cinnamate dioxygenase ferredoxin reductase subunit